MFKESSLKTLIPAMPEEIGIIMTYKSGLDLVVEWKIENFFVLNEEDGAEYWSPDFSFGNEDWYFRIYPNGWSKRDSYGHVGLWLIRYYSGLSIKQAFSLSLKTLKREKYNEQHCMEDFDNHNLVHEFNRFIPRSKLTRRRSEMVPDDVLTVVCTMKKKKSAESDMLPLKGNFAIGNLSSHQRKCMQRPVKCPDCLEVVVLQKWLDEHECQQERPDGAGSLCEDYKKVLLDGHDHNLILKLGDKEFRAHRDILRAQSRVFESMLDHDFKEKNTGIIDVSDCDPNAMELFLSYVYCGKVEALNHSNMLGLYYIADKYEMMELKRECCNLIKKSLSLTNICSIIQLALRHSDLGLLEYTTGYFSDNMVDVMQTVEWQCFLKENSTVGNELLLKSIKKLKNAQT